MKTTSPVLMYDGYCGVCAVASSAAARIAPSLVAVPDSRWGLKTDAVYVILDDDLIRGHKAVALVLGMSDSILLRAVSRVIVASFFSMIAATIYHLISSNRGHISRFLHLDVCRVGQDTKTPI